MNYKLEPINLNNGKAQIITIQTNEQNSLTKENMKELGNILGEIKKDDTLKGAIITSENPKFFCKPQQTDARSKRATSSAPNKSKHP